MAVNDAQSYFDGWKLQQEADVGCATKAEFGSLEGDES